MLRRSQLNLNGWCAKPLPFFTYYCGFLRPPQRINGTPRRGAKQLQGNKWPTIMTKIIRKGIPTLKKREMKWCSKMFKKKLTSSSCKDDYENLIMDSQVILSIRKRFFFTKFQGIYVVIPPLENMHRIPSRMTAWIFCHLPWRDQGCSLPALKQQGCLQWWSGW